MYTNPKTPTHTSKNKPNVNHTTKYNHFLALFLITSTLSSVCSFGISIFRYGFFVFTVSYETIPIILFHCMVTHLFIFSCCSHFAYATFQDMYRLLFSFLFLVSKHRPCIPLLFHLLSRYLLSNQTDLQKIL